MTKRSAPSCVASAISVVQEAHKRKERRYGSLVNAGVFEGCRVVSVAVSAGGTCAEMAEKYIKRVAHVAAERLSLAWGAQLGACKAAVMSKLYIALAGAHGRLIAQRVRRVQQWFEGQAGSGPRAPQPGARPPSRDPFFAGGEHAVFERVRISRHRDGAKKVRADGDPCIQWWCKALRGRQQGSDLQLVGVAPSPRRAEAELSGTMEVMQVGAG